MQRLKKLWSWVPVTVVLLAFAWSGFSILFYREHSGPPPGATVIRFGHWQLEASVREAIDQMAVEYRKIHPDVWIVQDAIPDAVYGQWISTQLMGGTVPDIVQVGAFLPDPIWIKYFSRYFLPLKNMVNVANPYNKGTDLAGIPLRKTFKDGMKTGYVNELQDYYSVPLTQFGTRIFYNSNLLYRLTGLAQAPKDYQSFIAACGKISSQKDDKGRPYVPIASSAYHFGSWDGNLFDPLTYGGIRKADFNRDGRVGNDEMFVAVRTGQLDFNYPPYRAKFDMMREVSSYFQTGYTGLSRDEAVFLFAQKRAVFMSTGIWDARSLINQAEGQFSVGIMDFPAPTKDDPKFGAVSEGPIFESPSIGFRFGVTRVSKHPDIAMDFLFFLASQDQNEKLNLTIGWIPCVIGAETDPFFAPFEPHLEGVYGAFSPTLGGETAVKYGQLLSAYQIGAIDYDTFAKDYTAFYKDQGLKDFMEQQRDWRRAMHEGEQFLAGVRSKALSTHGEESESAWVKYRALTAQRQVWPEVDHSRQMKLVEQGVPPSATGPYEYSPQVLEKIKARLRAEKKP